MVTKMADQKDTYHIVGPLTVVCLKCDKPFKSGDEVQQVIVSLSETTCEHKTMLRNIHKDCLEKSNG